MREFARLLSSHAMRYLRRPLRIYRSRWDDGRVGFYLFTALGLLLWRLLEVVIRRLNLPVSSLVSIDFSHRIPERDDALLEDVLSEYRVALEQSRLVPRARQLSVHWADYTAELARHLQPELIHDFRRKRLSLYGLGRGILDEDRNEASVTLSGGYIPQWGAIFRGEETIHYALEVATQFHRVGLFIDPGLLATLTEDPVGGPITPVHQGRRLSFLLLRSAYLLSNVIRNTDLPLTGPVTVCDIGGGYGGFAKLFKNTYRRSTYIIVDLPETLVLSSFYLRSNFPGARIATIRQFAPDRNLESAELTRYDFVLLPWWYTERLPSASVDLFFTCASMQEMVPESIAYYVEHIQRCARGYFYWINRLVPPARYGGVRFVDYPLDGRWQTVFVRHEHFIRHGPPVSPVGLHEWMALRLFDDPVKSHS